MLSLLELLAVILAALTIHEAAHAFALRRYGIPVTEFGIGLRLPPRLILRPRWLPFDFSLSPWLLGAYVSFDEKERAEALPYRDRAWWMGAGVFANLVSAVLTLAAGKLLINGDVLQCLLFAAGACLLAVFRRRFVAYAVPFLGVAVLLFLIKAVVDGTVTIAGPVGTVNYFVGEMGTLRDALRIFFVISVNLAAFNCLPIFPLDGGRIFGAVLHVLIGDRARLAFQRSTMLVMLGGVLIICVHDLFATAG